MLPCYPCKVSDVSIFQMKTLGLEGSRSWEVESEPAPVLFPEPHLIHRNKVTRPKWAFHINSPLLLGSTWPGPLATTLVEVGQRLFMQLHGWGRGSTQHILQGWQAGLVLRGQLGLLLLEDGQSEHITATHRKQRSGTEPQGAPAEPGQSWRDDADHQDPGRHSTHIARRVLVAFLQPLHTPDALKQRNPLLHDSNFTQ